MSPLFSLSSLWLLSLAPAALAQETPPPTTPDVSAPVPAPAPAPVSAPEAPAVVTAALPAAAVVVPEPTAAVVPVPTAAAVVVPEPTAAAARELSPTDAALEQRFLAEGSPASQGVGSLVGGSAAGSTPGWMWPLGLLGMAGVAGLVAHQRQRQGRGGVTSEVLVLSRTPISRTASLAVIEVMAADGATRRLLVGLGGGAPCMVADLSAPAGTAAVAGGAAAAVRASAEEEAWMRGASGAAPRPTAVEAEDVGEEEEAPRARRRGVAAYAAEAVQAKGTPPAPQRRRREEREDLLAEVLAEREREVERVDNPETGWKDPWARNFEALLGPSGSQGR